MTLSEPNWRNAAGTNGPPLMTSVDGTFQCGVLIRLDWGLTVFKRSLTTGAVTDTADLSSFSGLVTNGITPIVSDALGGDDHNHIACGLDDVNRLWVAGNSRGTLPLHMCVSAANSFASWTSWTAPFPGWAGSSIYGNYNKFLRLSDGRLLHFANRRDALANDEGLQIVGHILPLGGGTTWTPLATNGLLMDSRLTWNGTGTAPVPERIYQSGAFVEGPYHPHPDRVWLAGVWRDSWNDGATQHDPFIIYNDTVTDSSTWKRIDGTSQPMPCTYANTTGTSAIIPIFTSPYWFPSWTLIVDPSGHPHVMNFPVAGNLHVWWDGSAWQNETSGVGGRPALAILRNGSVFKYYASGANDTMVLTAINGTNLHRVGGPVPIGNPIGYQELFSDPIQLRDGVVHLLIPDGDTPVVYETGNHHRCTAS